MTTKPETKKPPAHEVIVLRITMLRERLEQYASDGATLYNPSLPTHTAPGQQMWRATQLDFDVTVAQAMVLIEVLTMMHIPNEARADVVRALRLLPSRCFPPTIERVFAEIEGDTGGA